jgi:3-phenylpropionate/cinnamic acid dioxygenase small subunit
VDTADIVAIQQLMALYGHVVDERAWERTVELFTADAIYDVSDVGLGVHHGIDAIRTLWTSDEARHPLAHHVNTVHVEEGSDGVVRVRSKVAAVGNSGRVWSFSYCDVVRRGADGHWRMAERVITLRRPTAEQD